MQCQDIFGHAAREAPYQCYDVVNQIGDQYGNYGINISQYNRCTRDNAVSGRLQCINVRAIPSLPDHTTLLSTYVKSDNLICWGTGYHGELIAHGIPDIGVINDGTACGHKKVCIKGRCVDSATITFDCLPGKCNS